MEFEERHAPWNEWKAQEWLQAAGNQLIFRQTAVNAIGIEASVTEAEEQGNKALAVGARMLKAGRHR